MSGNFRQFTLLLWKNWLLQKRRPVATVFEILLPVCFVVLLLAIRQIVNVTYYDNPTTWDSFEIDQFRPDLLPPNIVIPPGGGYDDGNYTYSGIWRLAYTPDHNVSRLLMTEVAETLGLDIDGLGFASEEDMVAHLMEESVDRVDILGGVVFTSLFYDNISLPQKVSYKIRLKAEQNFGSGGTIRFYVASDWYTSFTFPVYPGLGPRQKSHEDGGRPGYYREGFLSLQRALDLSIIHLLMNHTASALDDFYLLLQRFPYPPYIDDEFLDVLEDNFPFIVLMSFIITAPNIVKDLVLEKERRLRETMIMMGLKPWLSWCAWFIKYFLFMMISVSLMTLFFHIPVGNGAVINYSNASVTFVFLMLFAIATIMFCFMISSFISKANSGAAAGAILFLLTYMPFSFLRIPGRWEMATVADKMAASLFSNTAMALGCVHIASFEITGVGLSWSRINEPINSDNQFTMLHVLIMLIVDSIIYGIITWYLDAVIPGEYGLPRPLYFPFTKSYWCGTSATVSDTDYQEIDYGDQRHLFENSLHTLEDGIKIRNLTKEFKSNGVKKTAVNNLNLDIYSGQITALLGHNGAGKTTTISMLTGLIPPTHGTACVEGHDIRADMDGVRDSLGICPQHDVLFDSLTVDEHLQFFAQLKGFPKSKIKDEVESMIKVLHLENKGDSQSNTLSGGMKRKLCVGIALIAGSKVVILDEPTSGMDPEARRKTWDILQNARSGRTMILTTHFMDEADFLGDRIAIMASGVVQCCGSSLFLKNKYGVGYHMGIVKSAECDHTKITTLIHSHIPNAELESNISAELSYVLPSESSHKFEVLFDYMEKNKGELGILSYGVSVTTLEEVFIKVGQEMDHSLINKLQNGVANGYDEPPKYSVIDAYANEAYEMQGDHLQENADAPHPSTHTGPQPAFGVWFTKNTAFKLYIQQFWAMLLKKMIYTLRNKVVTLVQILIPFAFSIIPCILLYTLPGPRDAPELIIDLSAISNPESPYNVLNQSSPDPGLLFALGDTYKESLKNNATVVFINEQDGYQNDPNMTEYLIDQAEDLNTYRQSDMTAATFEGNISHNGVIGHFNNEGYHSTTQILSILGNTFLQYFVSQDSSIQCSNHPLPRAESQEYEEELNTAIVLAVFISYNVLFGMCFMVSTFVLFLVRERVSKAKHIQFVSGVGISNYWAANFVWDLITYLAPCFLLLILFAAFEIDAYYKSLQWGYMLVIFLLFAWSILPGMYLWSFLFTVPASAYVWAVVATVLLGTITNMVTGFLLYSYVVDVGVSVGTSLDWIFTVTLPPYNLVTAMQELYLNYQRKTTCGALESNIGQFCLSVIVRNTTHPCCLDNCGINCAIYHDNAFAWEYPGIGRRTTFMSLEGLVLFSLIFFIESGIWRKLLNNSYADLTSGDEWSDIEMGETEEQDSDVLQEQKRINSTSIQGNTDVLIVNNLTKTYDGSTMAVDALTFGVPAGECFGLLGVNGAGKTTTFKMLTGDVVLSAGEAYVAGYSVMKSIKQVQQCLGYCPQYDALIDQMTVRETLVMYARLRGVDEKCIERLVNNMIKQLLLDEFKDKQAGTLSGGNKRKLCTAISLVGEPPVVFLDEPTTGMDPVARRLLWDALTKFRASGKTLVLTSHSMEECEALCTRIAIMVNGQFKCLGSTQHLKNKFGDGYTLMAKINTAAQTDTLETEEQTSALMNFIEQSCPGSILKDRHHGYVHYQISNSNLSWAQIFNFIETKAKDKYNLSDYSISQTTLEQVFLNFAKAQTEPKEVHSGSCGSMMLCGCCCGCQNKSNAVHSTHL